jgi:hypothetical protein
MATKYQSQTLTCPVKGCGRRRKPEHLMCGAHWWTVTPELRQRIWRLYSLQKGSPEHLAAIREAFELVESPRARPPAA